MPDSRLALALSASTRARAPANVLSGPPGARRPLPVSEPPPNRRALLRRAARRLLPGRADWAPGAGGRSDSAPGKPRRKERRGGGDRRLSRGRDVRAAAAATAATAAATAAAAATTGGRGPGLRSRSPGTLGRQRRLLSRRLARRWCGGRLGGRGGRPTPPSASATAATPSHCRPAAATATPAARLGRRPSQRAPRAPGSRSGPRLRRRRPSPGGQQRRGPLPARGLGPERAGEGAAAAAQAPLPGCGRTGDAAASVLEPEGQVQLHRPLSEQPAGALQRYWACVLRWEWGH